MSECGWPTRPYLRPRDTLKRSFHRAKMPLGERRRELGALGRMGRPSPAKLSLVAVVRNRTVTSSGTMGPAGVW